MEAEPCGGASEDSRGDKEVICIDGNTSFFCLEAGNISSRSMGTPRDTRNKRRIRDRSQFGGCSGGGATNWAHSEALLSVRNIELSRGSSSRRDGSSGISTAYRPFRCSEVAVMTSAGLSSSS